MKMLLSMRLAQRLPLTIIAFIATVGLITGIAAYLIAGNSLEASVSEKLTLAAKARSTALHDYFEAIDEDLAIVADNPNTIAAVQEFAAAWQELGGNQTGTLQGLYIDDSPNPTGEKQNLDDAADGSSYSAVHARYHPWFHQLQVARDYYDVFLFDLDGNLVYTVFKELDYATNMETGEWRDTDLANAFRAGPRQQPKCRRRLFRFSPL